MSGGKRRPIDLGALQAVAIPQPDPVEEVARPTKAPPKRAGKAPAKRKATTAEAPARAHKQQQASRQGKVGIQFWTEPETRKQLKRFAMEHDRTLDDLLREAVANFMAENKIA